MRFFFFFNDTATTEIYTLSLHDALPISRTLHHDAVGRGGGMRRNPRPQEPQRYRPVPSGVVSGYGWHRSREQGVAAGRGDRKSTRLNSSHTVISYAVFCLKKKND